MKRVKESLVLVSLFTLVMSLTVMGCNKPTAEMKRAQAAIEDAKKAGAAEYAAGDLKSAEKALDDGKDFMDGLRYKKARSSFEEAYRLALAAKDKALTANKGRDVWASEGPASPASTYASPSSHTVYSGECLWWISEYKDVYADPFQWPLIYDANREKIDSKAKASGLPDTNPDGDAHWIFPGQVFDIPRDTNLDQIKDARKRAGAPAPYLPPGS